MSRSRDTDYANAHRVLNAHTQTVRVPAVVLGQLLSELDDGGRCYAEEALGPQLVQACIDLALRDETEEVSCLRSA